MVDELASAFHLLADVIDQAPSPSDSSNVVIAIIGAAGLVLAATVPVLLARWPRRGERVPLNSADDDEDDELRARNRALETFLWRRRFDPNRVLTGEESDADVEC